MCELFHDFDTTIAGCEHDNLPPCSSKKTDILGKLMKQQKFVSSALQTTT